MRLAIALLTALLLFAADPKPPASEKNIPGQKPLILINDQFNVVPGAWARYLITDKTKNETYPMYISTLVRERKKKKDCFWMEIEVAIPKNPLVATRILAEETKEGPGELMDVIVQVEGYDAFRVPKKFYQEKKGKAGEKPREVAQFKPAQSVKKLERKAVRYQNRTVTAWNLEAIDGDGRPLKALVSEEVPPIAVCTAETADTRMTLEDWGMGAKTKIRGEAVNFYLWVMDQVAKGMAQDKKAN